MSDPAPDAGTTPDDAPTALDLGSIGLGALVALAVVIPCGYALRGADTGSSGLLFLGVVIGFGLGGVVAGRHSRDRYLTHGAASGLAAVVVYLAIGLVAHAATGRAVRPVAVAFTGLLGICCGMLGASVGDRIRRRREADAGAAGDEP